MYNFNFHHCSKLLTVHFKRLLARLQAAEDEKKAFQEASNKYKMELDEKYEAQLKLESQVN